MLAFTLVVGAVAVGWVFGVNEQRTAGAKGSTSVDLERAHFALCRYDIGNDCVIDGDTFRYGGTTIRIADIDSPEVFSYGCNEERALGEQATRRLHALLNAGPFALANHPSRDEDQFGRKLRLVTRNGESLGRLLVNEGLAQEWEGARRPWC
jgi:endonuclease YncB( thermonuclease family)